MEWIIGFIIIGIIATMMDKDKKESNNFYSSHNSSSQKSRTSNECYKGGSHN
jgi:hypothetical protein